jgi:hypothetical protein
VTSSAASSRPTRASVTGPPDPPSD